MLALVFVLLPPMTLIQSAGGVQEPVVVIRGAYDEISSATLCGGEDLDGDSFDDFAFGRRHQTIVAHSGRSGAMLWQTFILHSSFGVIMIPDVDGDHRADVVVASSSLGEVSLLSGATGSLLWRRTVSGAPGLGTSIAATGDLDGDQVPEILALVPWGSARGTYVLSGATGALYFIVPHVVAWSNGTWGQRLAGVGDSNLDGYDDFLVGMVQASSGGGRVHLCSGADGSLLREYFLAQQHFGSSVANAGDLDHDGVPDHLIGARGHGSVNAFSGRTGQLLWTCTGPPSLGTSWFGTGLASCDDLDGDGTGDVLVGAPQHRERLDEPYGAAFLLSGATGGLLARLRSSTSAHIGDVVGALGEVTRDGRPALLLGGPGNTIPTFTDSSVELSSWHAGLYLSRDRLSASRGGSLRFELEFPHSRTGYPYWIVGSRTGPGPSTWRGTAVPLTFDSFTTNSFAQPWFPGAHGVLGAGGDAQVAVQVPPGVAARMLGATLWLAALSEYPYRPPVSSIARTLTIVP